MENAVKMKNNCIANGVPHYWVGQKDENNNPVLETEDDLGVNGNLLRRLKYQLFICKKCGAKVHFPMYQEEAWKGRQSKLKRKKRNMKL